MMQYFIAKKHLILLQHTNCCCLYGNYCSCLKMACTWSIVQSAPALKCTMLTLMIIMKWKVRPSSLNVGIIRTQGENECCTSNDLWPQHISRLQLPKMESLKDKGQVWQCHASVLFFCVLKVAICKQASLHSV